MAASSSSTRASPRTTARPGLRLRRRRCGASPPTRSCSSSGALLCSYAYRRTPFGIRACVSYDEGATWDIANEKIIRDDAVNGRISYPTAVQLEDDSVFAFYGINKACEPLPEEEKINGDNVRVYLAGSRFHQDWVRPEPAC